MPRMTSYRHGAPAWTDVSSPDIAGTGAFYCGLFGWEMSPDQGPESGGYRLFSKDGSLVAGIGPTQGGPPSWTTYFNVTDVDTVAGRVGGLGGTLVVPPMDLPAESGRIAFGVDPTGGFFGLFAAGANHFGAQLLVEPGSVAWNELNVRDVATAVPFYEALFGWSAEAMQGSDSGYQLLKLDGEVVAGVLPMGDQFPAHVPTNWLVYFAVEDVPASADRCAATGGGVVAPPFDTPVGPVAVLHDPTGAVFAIAAMTGMDEPGV